MDPYLTDWLSLLLRWLHVVAGAAWIGTSFYFTRLGHRMRAPREGRAGVVGDLWAVHGGGLFHVEKLEAEPEHLPETLHWFQWEAYVTWLSGFSLLVVVYYLGAAASLVDAATDAPSHAVATLLGIASLLLSWLVYDGLCRSPLARSPRAFAGVGFTLGTALAWALGQVLSPRAAYIHVGAALGTLMAANVFRVIIPNQRRIVAAMREGASPDPALGLAAAARSLHNNYLTLPVLFIMVSQHYPITYGHASSWAILAALCAIGAGVRHHFNLRARGRRSVWLLPAAAAALVTLAWIVRPRPAALTVGAIRADERVSFAQVQPIILRRCTSCHATRPGSPLFSAPPLGVVLETPQQIQQLARRIRSFAVDSHVMPLGNATAMSDDERALLARWIDHGAAISP